MCVCVCVCVCACVCVLNVTFIVMFANAHFKLKLGWPTVKNCTVVEYASNVAVGNLL